MSFSYLQLAQFIALENIQVASCRTHNREIKLIDKEREKILSTLSIKEYLKGGR